MLSRASKYAILSTLYLALHSSKEKKMRVKYIAGKLNVPSPFLAKLFQQLVRGNVISSTKGPHGGFYLSEDNSEKNVCDIIQNIDGRNKIDDCFLGLSECDEEKPCPVHFIFASFKENLYGKFKDKTIIEFAQEISESGRFLTIEDLSAVGENAK